MSTAAATVVSRARKTCGSRRTNCLSGGAASASVSHSVIEEPKINRNLALELLRVTEAGALSERGTMFTTHVHYMHKLVVGRKARGVIDLDMPAEWNLKRIAKAEGLPVQELTVVVLDRERNKEIIGEIRQVGARIKLIF